MTRGQSRFTRIDRRCLHSTFASIRLATARAARFAAIGLTACLILASIGVAPAHAQLPTIIPTILPTQILPTLTPTATPTLTATATDTATATATETATATQTATATETATATQTATATATPTPTATGTATGTETATATATPTATATATSTETATPTATATATGNLTISPTSLTFTNQEVGTSSTAKNVTLTNPNSSSLQIDSVTPSGDFSVSSDGCSGMDLASKGHCVVSVVFTPSQTGTRTGDLMITDAASNSPQTVSLTGQGILVKPTFSPAAVNFGNQALEVASAARTVTLTNPNKVSLSVTSVTASGDYTTTDDNCSGTQVAAGGTCTVGVVFTPSETGTRTGDLTYTDAAVNSPQEVALTGTGIILKPTFSPASLAFGDQQVDVASAAKTITLTNPNKVALSVSSVATSGAFSITNDMCSGTQVAAGSTCTFGVIFTPTQTGSTTGKVVVTDDAYITTQSINLSGVGYLATPTVSPTSEAFGRVQVSTVSAPKTVTLSNSNAVAVTFTSIATSGPFAITTNSCGSSVPANSTCQVSVTFNPTTDSNTNGTTETGKLTFTDNAQRPTQTVSLSGIAFGTPSVTPTATPTATTATVTPTPTVSATATPTLSA
ncbi:MAG: choice-of-anchor D domain-containing protein, partial [Candidatus Binatus sp.]